MSDSSQPTDDASQRSQSEESLSSSMGNAPYSMPPVIGSTLQSALSPSQVAFDITTAGEKFYESLRDLTFPGNPSQNAMSAVSRGAAMCMKTLKYGSQSTLQNVGRRMRFVPFTPYRERDKIGSDHHFPD
jgi:hypothetical protein